MTPKQLADAAFADPRKRAAWLDPTTRGLFCRLADAGERPDLEAAFGPVPPARWPGMESWEGIVNACQRVSMSIENVALEAGAKPVDVRMHQDASAEIVRTLALSGLAAGELVPIIGEDLAPALRPVSARAMIALEMLTAVREGWRMLRCDSCGGWHSFIRAPTGSTSYCTARCRVAAHAERTKSRA